ncbi:MAG: transglycosylase SLT domain-containing protein [Candidatus Parcubacteria bacterium]|nr:transglycosylase SLT domain-containing protein [Candidatus Parcubacteria bacterium]
MKINISVRFGKALLRVMSFGVALFSGVLTFFLTGPAVSESKELKVTQPMAITAPIKQQSQEAKVVKKEISQLRKDVYTQYQRKTKNGRALLAQISQYQYIIESAARYYNLDKDLIIGLIAYESGGDNTAVSGKQAKGLMQIYIAPQPCVQQLKKLFKVKQLDLSNPAHNIFLGAATLKHYIEQKQDLLLGLAAYNGGPNAIKGKSFTQLPNGIKRFPIIVYSYALMSKVNKEHGRIIPYCLQTAELFNTIALPGVE